MIAAVGLSPAAVPLASEIGVRPARRGEHGCRPQVASGIPTTVESPFRCAWERPHAMAGATQHRAMCDEGLIAAHRVTIR
jgi:hypothetical protein